MKTPIALVIYFWKISQELKCLQENLRFLKTHNLIAESKYRLNILDPMELLITLLMKEISTINCNKKSLRDYKEFLKTDLSNNKKTTQKSTRNVCKKWWQQKKIKFSFHKHAGKTIFMHRLSGQLFYASPFYVAVKSNFFMTQLKLCK